MVPTVYNSTRAVSVSGEQITHPRRTSKSDDPVDIEVGVPEKKAPKSWGLPLFILKQLPTNNGGGRSRHAAHGLQT